MYILAAKALKKVRSCLDLWWRSSDVEAQHGEQQPLQQVQGKYFPYSVYLSGSVQYAVCWEQRNCLADDPWFASCQPTAEKGVRRPRSTQAPGWGCPREDTYLGVSLLLPRAGAGAAGPSCSPGSPRCPPSAQSSRLAEPGLLHPGPTQRCSSERSQSQPAEEDQPMLARFPKASRHQGVEAAFWLPQAWSTVNNMPAVSADKPSLMRLQQKHSNMHYRTSVGIFFLELVFKKWKIGILDNVCTHISFVFNWFFLNYMPQIQRNQH